MSLLLKILDDEILTQNSDLSMASLDIDAIFLNILLDEPIHMYIKKLVQTTELWLKEYLNMIFMIY